MDSHPPQRHTFILRIWSEPAADADTSAIWRGWVQHVRSGESIYLHDPQELQEFIQRWQSAAPASPEYHLK